MNIITTMDGTNALIAFEGRLDTATSPQLEAELAKTYGAAKNVTFDFAKLEYLSSAGLRIILSAHKKLKTAGGGLTVANVNAVIKNVFDLTGFSDIIDII